MSGTHRGCFTGTGTDFDLYLQKWSGSSWATVARSEGSNSTESITYTGTAGTTAGGSTPTAVREPSR